MAGMLRGAPRVLVPEAFIAEGPKLEWLASIQPLPRTKPERVTNQWAEKQKAVRGARVALLAPPNEREGTQRIPTS